MNAHALELPQQPPGTLDGSDLRVKINELKPDQCHFIMDGVHLGYVPFPLSPSRNEADFLIETVSPTRFGGA